MYISVSVSVSLFDTIDDASMMGHRWIIRHRIGRFCLHETHSVQTKSMAGEAKPALISHRSLLTPMTIPH